MFLLFSYNMMCKLESLLIISDSRHDPIDTEDILSDGYYCERGIEKL
ncbi:MAG: hypothetical protein WCR55_12030 [Lentisphaerota bacterium]